MNPNVSSILPECLNDRHLEIVEEQFKSGDSTVTYLNTGSVGRKPKAVLEALNQGLERFNDNPTRITYFESEIFDDVREQFASLYSVDKESVLLLDSVTQGLQLILSSFLTKPGDEVIITNREHASINTILRHLEDTRGIIVKRYEVDDDITSEKLSLDLMNMVTGQTRIVATSEIDCYTGWRPDLTLLTESLKVLEVPLLVDGAHSLGNGTVKPLRYPLFVGAGHKWLGGPNSTAVAYVDKEIIPLLEPVWIGGGFYEVKEQEIYDLRRFECKGHLDPVKWLGFSKALELFAGLDQEHLGQYQDSLVLYLRLKLLDTGKLKVRTPGVYAPEGEHQGSMITFHAPGALWKTRDLIDSLWTQHKVWIQPDMFSEKPGFGGRISCHYSVTREDIDKFFDCLISYLN